MIDDRDRVRELWSVYDKAFWPDKNDPRIRFFADAGERRIFGRGGRVVTAVKLVAAIASGERMNVGENEKVGFPHGESLPTEARNLPRAPGAASRIGRQSIGAVLDTPPLRRLVESRKQARIDRDCRPAAFAGLEFGSVPPREAQRDVRAVRSRKIELRRSDPARSPELRTVTLAVTAGPLTLTSRPLKSNFA